MADTVVDKLIQEQHEIWTRMQTLDAIENPSDAETREYDDLDNKLIVVSDKIERKQRHAKRAEIDFGQVVDTGTPGEDDKDEKRDKVAEAQAAYRDAFMRYVRRGMSALNPKQLSLMEENFEGRALGEGTDSAGGYLVPDDVSTDIREKIKSYGGLLNLATVITTATGNALQWPTNDDTGNVGAILGENTQITEQDLSLGVDSMGAYTYTSKLVRVSWQLLNDSAFALEPWLARKLGERIGRAFAAHAVTGTGTNQPQGLLTGLTTGVTGTGTTAISFDNLVDLQHSIDPFYRANARFVLSDSAFKSIRKLKDADGRPLWNPVPAPGMPSTINGDPYVIELNMPAPGASAKTIVYGDIAEAYLVRQVQATQLVTMRERYADFLQTGFFAFARMDAKVVNADAASVFAHAAS